jgi:His-Xaa-Ser repeat protein HxsA
MNVRKFLIPSLLAAGFGTHEQLSAAVPNATSGGTDDPNQGNILQRYAQDHLVTLAQHRSHASHASHSSGGYSGGHASHASHSSGGYSGGPGHASHQSHTSHRSSATYEPYDDADNGTAVPPPPPPSPSYPAPAQRATPPSGTGGLVPPEASPQASLPALSGRTQRFASIVRRVEIALLAQGFYSGPIGGTVTPAVRQALRHFQTDRGLGVTGTITPQTLDALKVASE